MDYVIAGIRSLVLALGLNDDFVPALPVGLIADAVGLVRAILIGYAFYH